MYILVVWEHLVVVNAAVALQLLKTLFKFTSFLRICFIVRLRDLQGVYCNSC